jgi:hypothetical protein
MKDFVEQTGCTERRDRVSVGNRNWTAPGGTQPKEYFTVTHPFHPWRGRRLELIECQRQWGLWRVCYLTVQGHRAYFPASWTDVGPRDPFVEQARGRAVARTEDLLELTRLIESSAESQLSPEQASQREGHPTN